MELSSSINSPTASANLAQFAGRIRILESLYIQASQTCRGLEDRIEEHDFRSLYKVRDPLYPVESPLYFRVTMKEIAAFLNFLAGQQLTWDEVSTINTSRIDFLYSLAPYFVNSPRLFNAIEPIINWLSNVVNQCQNLGGSYQQLTQQSYPAADNLLRIANRIKLLENFYEEALYICEGLENNLEGYGTKFVEFVPSETKGSYLMINKHVPLTFKETLDRIQILLKTLNGQPLSNEENKEENKLTNFTLVLTPSTENTKLDFDNRVEPVILWLYNTLNKCRQVQSGLPIIQQQHLANLYSPTSQFAQQAAQRFYRTAGQQY